MEAVSSQELTYTILVYIHHALGLAMITYSPLGVCCTSVGTDFVLYKERGSKSIPSGQIQFNLLWHFHSQHACTVVGWELQQPSGPVTLMLMLYSERSMTQLSTAIRRLVSNYAGPETSCIVNIQRIRHSSVRKTDVWLCFGAY